jgi:hypothetical protein
MKVSVFTVTAISFSGMHRSLFHPLATVRHRTWAGPETNKTNTHTKNFSIISNKYKVINRIYEETLPVQLITLSQSSVIQVFFKCTILDPIFCTSLISSRVEGVQLNVPSVYGSKSCWSGHLNESQNGHIIRHLVHGIKSKFIAKTKRRRLSWKRRWKLSCSNDALLCINQTKTRKRGQHKRRSFRRVNQTTSAANTNDVSVYGNNSSW